LEISGWGDSVVGAVGEGPLDLVSRNILKIKMVRNPTMMTRRKRVTMIKISAVCSIESIVDHQAKTSRQGLIGNQNGFDLILIQVNFCDGLVTQ
jgi:hypothetical protein